MTTRELTHRITFITSALLHYGPSDKVPQALRDELLDLLRQLDRVEA